MGRLLTLPGSRRLKWIFATVWMVAIAGALVADLPAKYQAAESNESTSYLPGDAESTRALVRADELRGGEQAPMVIVYRREGGLTQADRRRIEADRAELNRAIETDRETYGAVSPFAEPQISPEGDAALLIASIAGDGEEGTILDPVADVRERVSDPGGGLEVKVTGPAGFAADSIEIFQDINSTLLLTAGGLVAVLLVLIYRSPIFLWIPLLTVAFAEIGSRSIGYGLSELGVAVNTQSSAILSVLVLGAGTDYALLLVSRYREELRRHTNRHEAMAYALRTAGPAILASGATVIAALLCLSLAEVEGTAGLGPIGALGIAVAMVSMLTLLPSLLVIAGRRAFWRPPVFGWSDGIPRYGDEGSDETNGVWRRIGDRIAVRPRRTWIGVTAVLLVMTLGWVSLDTGLTSSDGYREEVESVQGQQLLAQSFPAGANAPTEIIVSDPAEAPAVADAVRAVPGVASVEVPGAPPGGPPLAADQGTVGTPAPEAIRGAPGAPDPAAGPGDATPGGEASGDTLVNVILEPPASSSEAYELIPRIRAAARTAAESEVLVGGTTAIEHDTREAAARDTLRIVPIALAVVFVILIVLLRSLVAPILLMATVVLSFAAAIGFSLVVFDVIFGFPGIDPSLPLYGFVFLVALGIDYNIFLMARVREETERAGTRQGMLRGLAVTGGVITSAGIVLAGTFSVLTVLPLVFITEIGFVIAFGVLLDTFVVRSILVPALVLDIGPKTWWPSRLARPAGEESTHESEKAGARRAEAVGAEP